MSFRITLFFLCIFSLLQLNAQFLEFPESGGRWDIQTAYYDGMPPSNTYEYYYYSNGTQNIAGKNYVVISGRRKSISNLPPFLGEGQMNDQYIRTDTVTGIVYRWDGNMDVFLFHYNYQVGDTISQCPIIVDSVFYSYLCGKNRKVLRYHSDIGQNRYIIEGLGTSNGIFVTKQDQQYSCFEWVCDLRCFSLNNEAFDQNANPVVNNCPLPAITPPDTSCFAYFEIYPDASTPGLYFGNNLGGGLSGQFLNYRWSFGDDSISYAQYPSHTYATPGQYNVCLRVTNLSGC